MMDVSQPDPKRIRLGGHPPRQWHGLTERQLPPPPSPLSASYPSHPTPFHRPDSHPTQIERGRRPSEYESQDIRRPSSGPHVYHHPPGPSYLPPRDPIVKRDPSDEPHYRPSSTGNPTENANSPQNQHELPSRPSQNFDAGRPQQYPQRPYPVAPVPMTESYGHSYSSPGPPPPPPRNPDPYTHLPYSGTRVAEQQVRKKAQRAAQACDSCRTAKAKCDEGRPSCTSCKENGKECRYRDPPPKQQDKASADIMDSLSRLESVLQNFSRQMDHLTNEVNEIKMAHHLTPQPLCSTKPLKQETVENKSAVSRFNYQGTDAQTTLEPTFRSSNGSVHPVTASEQLNIYSNSNTEEVNNMSDEDDDVATEPGPPRQPSIPVNHTTGAGRLLLVPPIKRMCADIMLHSKFKSEKYPYLQEWKRGLLRLYGRGEGNQYLPGYEKEPTIDYSDMTPGEVYSDVFSPTPGEEWGQIGGANSPSSRPMEYSRGEAKYEGMPDFSRETVLELVESYKKNINNMHPILTPKQLDQLVENFLRSIPDGRRSLKRAKLISSDGPQQSDNPDKKRKLSSTASDYSEVHPSLEQKTGYPFRTINSAIVMLCMALGKICLGKKKIQQVPSDQELYSSFGNPAVIRNSPTSISLGSDSPSDADAESSRNQKLSLDASQLENRERVISKLKNTDVIPGLIYFALATDVLGNQIAGSSLQHVHANILAGLYHAQLARIMESAAYISNACRALQVILRPRLERFRKTIDQQKIVQAKDNPLIFAFWTCLQLESDIVAEIPCPQTGILTFEEDMPGPNLQAAHHDDGFDKNVIESYSAQLFLRKHLNSLHCMFYKPRDPNSEDKFASAVLANTKRDGPKFPSIELLSQSLNGIDVYAPTMRWMVDQPEPPNDILGARLRAKYYGAQVITYRPFVLQVLERSEPLCNETYTNGNETISDEYLSEVQAPVVRHDIKKVVDIDPKALEYVRMGLQALIKSTTAFHGLGDPAEKRIIVTNVWGTAHAQWGNVLTLQAAYLNPILNPLLLELITKDELIGLIEKTMGFLALVGSPSSALAIDWKILDMTSRKNGLRRLPIATSPNFPSNTLGEYPMSGH